MNILGISAFYHDSAACLVRDGEIIAAAQEERFTRKKHDSAFPKNAVEYCLREGGISLAQVDYVAFYEKPFVKFDRILHSYLAYAPAGLKSFLMAIPLWIRERIWMKELIRRGVARGDDGRLAAATGRKPCRRDGTHQNAPDGARTSEITHALNRPASVIH